MVVEKYLDFLISENRKWQAANRDIKIPRISDTFPKNFSLKGLFTGVKLGKEVADKLENFVSSKEDAIKEVGKFVFDCKEEVSVLDKSVNKLREIENRYWNFSTSAIYVALILYMLINGLKVEEGATKKAEKSFRELTGETLDIESKRDNVKKFKEESDKMRKEYEKKLKDLQAKVREEKDKSKELEEENKRLEEERKKLEKEKKDLEKKNKELKERERLKDISKRLNQLDVKIKGTNQKSRD